MTSQEPAKILVLPNTHCISDSGSNRVGNFYLPRQRMQATLKFKKVAVLKQAIAFKL